MSMKFDVDRLRIEMEFLRAQYPELDEDEDLRIGMLEGETTVTEVLTELLHHREDAKAMVEGTGARMQELAERIARFKKRAEYYTQLMQSVMWSAQIRKIELPEATISMKNNPQQLIGEGGADELPDELVKIKREPDRKKIREALLAGQDVPGYVLNNAPPSMVVRVK